MKAELVSATRTEQGGNKQLVATRRTEPIKGLRGQRASERRQRHVFLQRHFPGSTDPNEHLMLNSQTPAPGLQLLRATRGYMKLATDSYKKLL